jgi:hypothetical protein
MKPATTTSCTGVHSALDRPISLYRGGEGFSKVRALAPEIGWVARRSLGDLLQIHRAAAFPVQLVELRLTSAAEEVAHLCREFNAEIRIRKIGLTINQLRRISIMLVRAGLDQGLAGNL